MPSPNGTQRLHYLDSARGLAALSVTTLHFLLAVYGLDTTGDHFTTPFKIFWNGEAAVLFFYIHSGFILSYTFTRRGWPLNLVSYGKFLMERIFRIYPLFLVVLVTSFIAVKNTVPYPPQTEFDYISRFWFLDFSIRDVLQQAILVVQIPASANHRLIPQDWTLTVELLAGAAIPLLAIAGRKHFLLFLGLLTGLKISGICSTYIIEFGLGVGLFLFMDTIKTTWAKLNIAFKILILLAAIAAYTGCFVFPAIFTTQPLWLDHRIDRLIVASGCVLAFMILLSSARVQKLLSVQPLVLTGKICYSIYLVHQLLLFIGWRLFGDTLGNLHQSPIWEVACVYILFLLLVFVCSYAGYKLVELPMIRLGKRILSSATAKTAALS